MRSVAVVVPGPLDTPTGGSIYDRRMVEGLRGRGWQVDVVELGGAFPFPEKRAVSGARRALAALPDGCLVVFDGLAFSALPAVVSDEASRLRFVPVVHLPLAEDIGLSPEQARELERCERQALAVTRAVVVTGTRTRETLVAYGVPRERIHLIQPGTSPAPLAHGSGRPTVEILCVATVNPGKAHDLLIRALAVVPDTGWHLTCVGSLTRYPDTAEALRALIRREQLDDRVTLAGEQHGAALEAYYDASDVFALATLKETFGMAVAEALAHGLPVVSTTTGAIPDLVGTDAGFLVEPGDERGFAAALTRMIGDAALRQRLAAGARLARQHLPTWDEAFDKMAGVLDRLHD